MPRRDFDDEDDDRDSRRSRDPREDDRYDRYQRDDDRHEPRSRDDRRRDRDAYDDDDDYDYGRRRRLEDHRGTLILVLGLCGVLVCALCAPAAWIMGSQDLAKMRAGQMDYAGYGQTQAGYVLGIIGTLLTLGAIILVVLLLGVVAKGG